MTTSTLGTVRRYLLRGLRPEPIGSYLAGLGLIRALGEQADPAAAAAWTSDGLLIVTSVADIASWLAGQYVPTPVLSPWNNGSGFGAKDKEPRRALEALRGHPSPRLAPLQAALPVAQEVTDKARARGWITDAGTGGDKRRVVQEFRNHCPDALLPWIDATVVLSGQGTFFPPLLGTGGNDGRLDFSTNFHQRLLEVLGMSAPERARSLGWAQDLLGGTETEQLTSAAAGQFDPARAGGPGSSPFGAADSLVNPWAYILLVEGALLFAASAARRNQHYRQGDERAAMPFTVYGSPDGSASGAAGEESRGEVWVPVWRGDFTLAEIRQLFTEARASWRGRPARRAADFYAATRSLGVARGIDEFARYGLHRRNGLAFTAVPLDRITVHENTDVRLAADVEDWAARFNASNVPGAIHTAARQFQSAHLLYARDGGPLQLARMLAALTLLEEAVGRSGRTRDEARPRRLPPARDFLPVLTRDGVAPEWRIAIGLASCATRPGADPAAMPPRSMRQILLPLDPPVPGDRAQPNGRWRDSPLVPGLGKRSLAGVLAEVLIWRSHTAAGEHGNQNFRGIPGFRGIEVPAADLHALARGQLDEAALEQNLRACLALDWRGVRPDWTPSRPPVPVPTLGLLHPFAKGLTPEGAGSDAPRLALRPDWPARLAIGQVRQVHEQASARLRQAGWNAVPAPPRILTEGTWIAAALVPRCLGAGNVLGTLASRLKDEPHESGGLPETSPHPSTAKESS
jgi:CRISPR-associated protein Csx17